MRTYNTIELCATNWYWFILRTISAMLRLFQHFLFRCYLPKCASIFCIFEIQRKFHGNLNIPKCSFFRPKYNRNEKFFSQKVFIRNSISSYLQLDLCTRLKTKKNYFVHGRKFCNWFRRATPRNPLPIMNILASNFAKKKWMTLSRKIKSTNLFIFIFIYHLTLARAINFDNTHHFCLNKYLFCNWSY